MAASVSACCARMLPQKSFTIHHGQACPAHPVLDQRLAGSGDARHKAKSDRGITN
jgi:hypothetical protein